MEEPIHCVLSCDERYAQHMAVTLHSLLTACGGTKLSLHIISCGISQHSIKRLESIVLRWRTADVTFYDVENSELGDMPEMLHLSKAAYARLLAGNVLPISLSRIVYLDSDMVVMSSLLDLWRLDLEGRIAAVAPDPHANSTERLGIPAGTAEFNSGVMLIDLQAWRAEGVGEQSLAFIRAHPSIIRYADQDALNVVLLGKVKMLGYEWNFQTQDGSGKRGRVIAADIKPRIVHFSTHLKPWNYRDMVAYEGEYLRHLRATPWAGARQRGKNPKTILGRTLRRLVPALR